MTPNGLHFERHHSGVPDIDPAQHELKIHGAVRRPLKFSVDSLLRYPMTSKFYFLECSGNGFLNLLDNPLDASCGTLNGLVSCSEWTGIKLSLLLEEAGIDADASWLIAEGADSASLVRSIPLEKALDDVLIALFQNGERIRPEQGYPMRLFVPGWEGNVSVKWLHRLKVASSPAQSRSETATYTDLMPDGRAEQFTFTMGVKSVITHPSGTMNLAAPGIYELAGIAWSGHGAIARVEVSADGGKSWAKAALDAPVIDKCVCRFRIPWQWDGVPATLMSRATDSAGNVQPTRAEFQKRYSPGNMYHFNGILAWGVEASGRVSNVYV
jgi:sulfane dehydrogenase subunit SoxC